MVLIFLLSAQTATDSSETSGNIIELLARIFYSDFSVMSEIEQNEIIGGLQFFVRKAAHFSLYMILGFLSFLSVISYRNIKFSYRVYLSLFIPLIYAVSDEIHQLFVPGRSGEVRDVCIDFCGALLSVVISSLFSRYIKRIYKHITYKTGD